MCLKTLFSLTKCLLHAGRIVTQSLEKSKAHVLLYSLPQLKYAEDLLLRCEGKDIFHQSLFNFCACGHDSNPWKLVEMSVKSIHEYTCVITDAMHLCFCWKPCQAKIPLKTRRLVLSHMGFQCDQGNLASGFICLSNFLEEISAGPGWVCFREFFFSLPSATVNCFCFCFCWFPHICAYESKL